MGADPHRNRPCRGLGRGVFVQAYEFADSDPQRIVFTGDLIRVAETGDVQSGQEV